MLLLILFNANLSVKSYIAVITVTSIVHHDVFSNGQNPLSTFPLRSCQIVADMLQGRYGEISVMNFGKTCYGEVVNLLRTNCLRGNLCYGFWP